MCIFYPKTIRLIFFKSHNFLMSHWSMITCFIYIKSESCSKRPFSYNFLMRRKKF